MSGKDQVLDKKVKEKNAKSAKRELFNDRNKGDFHPEQQHTEASCSSSSNIVISTENIIHTSRTRQKETVDVKTMECSADEDSAESQIVSHSPY